MRSRTARITLTIVCFAVGALLMIQLQTQGHISKVLVTASGEDQTAIISNLYQNNVELRHEVEKLTAQQQDYQRSFEGSDLTDMVSELNKLRIFNGQSEVSGPGVELMIPAAIRPEDVEDLINELRNAGAEAIAVNGQRVVVSSSVTTSQGVVMIDHVAVDPPFTIQAIGEPDTLDRALERKGGLLSYLRNTYPDGDITLTKQAKLTLPIYGEMRKLQNAEVASS